MIRELFYLLIQVVKWFVTPSICKRQIEIDPDKHLHWISENKNWIKEINAPAREIGGDTNVSLDRVVGRGNKIHRPWSRFRIWARFCSCFSWSGQWWGWGWLLLLWWWWFWWGCFKFYRPERLRQQPRHLVRWDRFGWPTDRPLCYGNVFGLVILFIAL